MAKKGKGPRRDEFVLDCSVALAWCFPDEKAPYPQAVLTSLAKTRAIVPVLWPLEIANTLLVGERRGRSTEADTAAWLAFLRPLPISIDQETTARAWVEVLQAARLHAVSAYDAAYLELALRLTLPLATLDRRLKIAAKAAGVKEFKP
jgi:predicted nucleic acid-binding protein